MLLSVCLVVVILVWEEIGSWFYGVDICVLVNLRSYSIQGGFWSLLFGLMF